MTPQPITPADRALAEALARWILAAAKERSAERATQQSQQSETPARAA